jgi:hypothetical protein
MYENIKDLSQFFEHCNCNSNFNLNKFIYPDNWNFIGYTKERDDVDNEFSICIYYHWKNTFLRRVILNHKYGGGKNIRFHIHENRYTKFSLKNLFKQTDYVNSWKGTQPYRLNAIDKLNIRSLLTQRNSKHNDYKKNRNFLGYKEAEVINWYRVLLTFYRKDNKNFYMLTTSYHGFRDFIVDIEDLERNSHILTKHDYNSIKGYIKT